MSNPNVIIHVLNGYQPTDASSGVAILCTFSPSLSKYWRSSCWFIPRLVGPFQHFLFSSGPLSEGNTKKGKKGGRCLPMSSDIVPMVLITSLSCSVSGEPTTKKATRQQQSFKSVGYSNWINTCLNCIASDQSRYQRWYILNLIKAILHPKFRLIQVSWL